MHRQKYRVQKCIAEQLYRWTFSSLSEALAKRNAIFDLVATEQPLGDSVLPCKLFSSPPWGLGGVFYVMHMFKYGMVKFALDKGVSKAQISRDLEISKTSLYRIIGELQKGCDCENLTFSTN